MNAYKLADELEFGRESTADWIQYLKEVANMLRQQADRIAELERKAKAFEQSCRVATTQIKALQAELETPQTKPLSDEEIIDIHMSIPLNNIHYSIKLARAIEERHGIK